MKEIINLMNNTIVLSAIIVVGGAGRYWSGSKSATWPKVENEVEQPQDNAQGFESPAPPSF